MSRSERKAFYCWGFSLAAIAFYWTIKIIPITMIAKSRNFLRRLRRSTLSRNICGKDLPRTRAYTKTKNGWNAPMLFASVTGTSDIAYVEAAEPPNVNNSSSANTGTLRFKSLVCSRMSLRNFGTRRRQKIIAEEKSVVQTNPVLQPTFSKRYLYTTASIARSMEQTSI